MRKISKLALEKLEHLEGCKLTPYKDTGGIVTIGYGHTNSAGGLQIDAHTSLSKTQAEQILLDDLKQYEQAVEQHVQVPLYDSQFDALVLFCYNVGIGNFCKSSLLRKLNLGKYDAVPQELMKWSYVKKRLCPGLMHRRTAEIMLWKMQEAFVKKKNPKRMWQNLAAIFAPLGGLLTALGDLISQAPILQIALIIFIIPGSLVALYYYHKYRRLVF